MSQLFNEAGQMCLTRSDSDEISAVSVQLDTHQPHSWILSAVTLIMTVSNIKMSISSAVASQVKWT